MKFIQFDDATFRSLLTTDGEHLPLWRSNTAALQVTPGTGEGIS